MCGRLTYSGWVNHYNTLGKLAKLTQLVKAKLKSLNYNNEKSMSFETCTSLVNRCFIILDKDDDEQMSL
jgi:hypothetical protein